MSPISIGGEGKPICTGRRAAELMKTAHVRNAPQAGLGILPECGRQRFRDAVKAWCRRRRSSSCGQVLAEKAVELGPGGELDVVIGIYVARSGDQEELPGLSRPGEGLLAEEARMSGARRAIVVEELVRDRVRVRRQRLRQTAVADRPTLRFGPTLRADRRQFLQACVGSSCSGEYPTAVKRGSR